MEQLPSCEAIQARKPCWSCGEFIPYAFGYCATCWNLLAEEEQVLLLYSASLAPTLGGAIRMALTDRARVLRNPPRQEPTTRLSAASILALLGD